MGASLPKGTSQGRVRVSVWLWQALAPKPEAFLQRLVILGRKRAIRPLYRVAPARLSVFEAPA